MEEDLESRSTAPSDTGARTAATAPRSGSDTDSSSSTLAYDKHFICSAPGLLTLTELVFGLLVWMLVGGTEFGQVLALACIMCVAVGCWLLTLGLLVVCLIGTHSHMPRVPWNTMVLCFNSVAAVLYSVVALVETAVVAKATRGRHSYHSWMASTICAFLVAVCYTLSACLSFREWKKAGKADEEDVTHSSTLTWQVRL
ncbi:CKLF-like MARVEL transmembrane domain-containing protein 8 [Engraulis encrasicolus]|uniref:CKLF-like MARVEL transmembrane domain-containing protein 8 n=1 Tax=Engraulis encrasicolus TaxID=184585 RepID=UPI002FD52052